MKKCSRCHQLKDESEFAKCPKSPDKLRYECKECDKKYRQEHKEHIGEYRKKYYQRNKGKSKLIYQHWLAKNREKKEQYQKIYRDEKRYDGNRIKVLERDNYTCQICGIYTDNIHHKDGSGLQSKYPTAPLPNNALENLITICRSCHIIIHKPEKLRWKSTEATR